ncbi:YybH family protein [Anaeromyxobacter diazotrophicus]|uniref:DUF4440 domain-containing protein n=1 Tax=Anaeromyxobacter diazotrophicus TaxID=2590199 RepID=A0A7I9VQ23_9BACT|nr:nuclear transport factor 2 family protein [Anaeromyxobacter diazotrophicus]GEJ58516.1 hypothetical protein AMYX_32570 [Anaeromyxobacter diazotrophicus]
MEQTGTNVAGPQQQAKGVEASLEAALRQFTEAFNRLDAKAVASCWAEDGTLINPIGNHGQGRAGVERVFREDAEAILGGTTSSFRIASVRRIGDDCALLDLDHEAQNWTRPDGSSGTLKLHVVILAQKKGESWQWLDARPYAFMQRPQRVH